MLRKTIFHKVSFSKQSLLKTTEKSFSLLLHEYQGQALLKKYSIPTPKVN